MESLDKAKEEQLLAYFRNTFGGEGSWEEHLTILGLRVSANGSQSHRLTGQT